MLRLTLICTVLTLIAGNGLAKDKQQDGTEIKFDQVLPARSIINRRVEDQHGVLVGTVADIVIDQKYGRVAFFAVNSRRAKNTTALNYFLPPAAVKHLMADGRLQVNAPLDEIQHVGDLIKPVPMTFLNPDALKKLYTQHDAKPYWDSPESSSDGLNLVTVDELDGRIIRNDRWEKVARVEEVVLAPMDDWRVAYMALNELPGHDRDSARLAVPMGAFARRTLSPTWLLDVPDDAELLKKTFPAGDWPTEIDRGWIEFTHVKYGSSPLNGLVDLQHTAERTESEAGKDTSAR